MFYVALEVVTVGRWYRCECLFPFKHLKKTDKLVPRFDTNANNYLNLYFALIIPKRVKRPWAQVASERTCGRLTSLPRKKKSKKWAAQNFRSKKNTYALWWSERCVELRYYNSTTAHSTRKCGALFGHFSRESRCVKCSFFALKHYEVLFCSFLAQFQRVPNIFFYLAT